MALRMNGRIRKGLMLAALAAAAGGLAGCDEAQKGFEQGFEKQFVESFGPSCESSATGAGAPAGLAKTVCKCAADELIAKYDPSDLMNLSPDKAMPVMQACAKKAGIEVPAGG